MRTHPGWLLLVVVVSGCASGAGNNRGVDPNRISTGEIQEAQRTGLADAYELIQRARPRWLQIRSERSMRLETTILVYQNDSRIGGLEVLRGYPLAGISSIRYLDAAQAGLLPGAGSAHVESAIVIATTLRGNER
jgi:hypothetical protein